MIEELQEAVDLVRGFLSERDARLEDVIERTGFECNAAIAAAKEAVNEDDGTRKRFEVMARALFRKYRACMTLPEIRDYRPLYEAVNIVYKSLQSDREKADITDIIQDIHRIVDEAVQPTDRKDAQERPLYDISKIDFERLRREYERQHGGTHNAIQSLRDAIEKRLQRMLADNPLRTNFQQHYEELVARYNQEKDRQTIEQTFEELLKVAAELDRESERAAVEGMNEETLAIFDLLKKPELSHRDLGRIKSVARELLTHLKDAQLQVNRWKEKQATRDAVHAEVHDFLYSDDSGLPDPAYSPDEVEEKTEAVFHHLLFRYGQGQGARPHA